MPRPWPRESASPARDAMIRAAIAKQEREVADAARCQADAIERACEAALQGGECGVMVDHVAGVVYVSPLVPYGHIYERGALIAD